MSGFSSTMLDVVLTELRRLEVDPDIHPKAALAVRLATLMDSPLCPSPTATSKELRSILDDLGSAHIKSDPWEDAIRSLSEPI